jgi:D-alanyl-lipoteichoic acid acyltransferase DltB (MBOAT superfamily)
LLFPTAEYGIFLLCIFAAAWALRRHLRAHKGILLVASYGFYAFWNWRFLPLLVGISLLAAAVGRGLQLLDGASARKTLLALGVTLCLATLVVFKYLGFLASAALNLFELASLHPSSAKVPEVALPVGISFFVFHAISLMVDAFRGRISMPIRALDALLYVAFFPQLIAGPILRAESFLPQLAKPPDPESIDASRALELIATGLAKKVLIANVIAGRLVDPVFESIGTQSGLEALLAVYGYAAQIYCDFSGYSDIAVGSALLLGYRLPENFNSPYLATNPREFWRRWHVSLSTWLRDYLFIPLGGSRRSGARVAANLAITLVLGGLWHGAAWTFVLWGAFHAAGLVVHRLWSDPRAGIARRLRAFCGREWVARFLTFHFVCIGWIFFRSPSIDAVWEFFKALGRWKTTPTLSAAVMLALCIGLLTQLFPAAHRATARKKFSRLPLMVQGFVLAMAIFLIEALAPQGVAPFIYFQF